MVLQLAVWNRGSHKTYFNKYFNNAYVLIQSAYAGHQQGIREYILQRFDEVDWQKK